MDLIDELSNSLQIDINFILGRTDNPSTLDFSKFDNMTDLESLRNDIKKEDAFNKYLFILGYEIKWYGDEEPEKAIIISKGHQKEMSMDEWMTFEHTIENTIKMALK